MASRKDNTPSVATYADHEVITPPNPLRKAAARPVSGDDDDPVARAEAALAQLSAEFAEWMQAECERLEAPRAGRRAMASTKKTHDELFRAAHDIKGEAATFGYPEVAPARRQPVPAARAYAGHDAHSARARRSACRRDARHRARTCARRISRAVAGALTQRLREVTDEFLAHRKQRPAGLSGKHLRAVARAVAARIPKSPAAWTRNLTILLLPIRNAA